MAFPANPLDGDVYFTSDTFFKYSDALKAWKKVEHNTIIKWNAEQVYDHGDEITERAGHLYVSIEANVNKDPAIAANSQYWFRVTPRVFVQDEDPSTSAGGGWAVFSDDIWINRSSSPYTNSENLAELMYLRTENQWVNVSGAIRVVAQSDSWDTRGKTTELVLLEKHIDDTALESGSVVLAFVDRANYWKEALLWNHPWGFLNSGNSDDFVGITSASWNTIFSTSIACKKGRRYRVDATLRFKVATSASEYKFESWIQADGSDLSRASWLHTLVGSDIADNEEVSTHKPQGYYNSTAAGNVTFRVVAKNHETTGGQAGKCVIRVEDVGPW